MKTKLSTLFLIVGLANVVVTAQKNVLFVGVDGDVSGSPDFYLIDELFYAAPDYTITFLSGPDFAADDSYKEASGYSGYDAVFFSESAASGDLIPYKDAGFPIPAVCTEGYAPRTDKWALITNDETQHDQINSDELEGDNATITITDNTHYITSVFGAGYELDWTTDTERGSGLAGCGFKLKENIPDAVPLGSYSLSYMADFPSLWAIPDGSRLQSDTTISLPRMAFIGTYITTLGEYATEDINTVFVRSLQWVMDDLDNTAVPSVTTSSIQVVPFPNPARDEVSFLMNLDKASEVGLTLYDLTGRIVQSMPATRFGVGENTLEVDLSTLERAMYLYRIDINGVTTEGKLVVAE